MAMEMLERMMLVKELKLYNNFYENFWHLNMISAEIMKVIDAG